MGCRTGEQTYFGRLGAGAADPDHDGVSNLAEWLAGTNPTNAASCLRVLAPILTTTNTVVVRWPSVSGRTYRLERATNLIAGFDTVVRSNIAATPPINSAPDTMPQSKPYYYRVELEE